MTFIIPIRFQYLTTTKKVKYKATNLKIVCLFHLIHHFIYNYAFDKDEIRLSSNILQADYGMHYLRYIEYLVEHGFIVKTGNYSADHGRANKYKIIEKLADVFVYHSTDFVFNKKHRVWLANKIKQVKTVKSTIPVWIRQKLLADLRIITLDNVSALHHINVEIKANLRKYLKNLIMITKIQDSDLFFKFDKHGRFHTNFTNLRKEIRNQYLKIEGEPIAALDVKSSQPFFLAQILKNEWLLQDNPEIKRFIKIVEDRDLYKYFLDKYPTEFTNRDSVKPMVFKCLFDKRKYVHHYKAIFRNEFPTIYEFVANYPITHGEYLWKTLQRLESGFIFNNIYPAIINEIKDIKLFTVHDSIHFPLKYYPEIKRIWDDKMNKLIKK